jgi:glycosyltransferase involved in cell wall biosynthesis
MPNNIHTSDGVARLPVAVVIPAHNRANMVARAVRSALTQRPNPPTEVIVVDDCSNDETGEAARLAGARVIRHHVNRGEAEARNTAIRAATQPWVALLDSDDEWLPHHLAELWRYRHGRVILGSTAMACAPDSNDGRLWGREKETPRVLESPADLLADGNALVASSVMVRRDVLIAVGGFRADMKRGADLDLWLRVLEHGSGWVSPSVTLIYGLHEGQVSVDRRAMWSAHRAIVEAYAGRVWCTRGLRRRIDAVLLWDELRADLRESERRLAVRHALALILDPQKAYAVGRLLAVRFLLRRRSSRYACDGGASVRVWSSSPAVAEWAGRQYPHRLTCAQHGAAQAIRRPAGLTVTDSAVRAVVARLGGSRTVRVRSAPKDVCRVTR